MPARLSLVVFLCLSLALGAGWTQEDSPDVTPHLVVEIDSTSVELRGVVSSPAHYSILQQSVMNYFADKTPVFDLTVKPALPPGWALTTEIVLRALSTTRSASAEINVTRITVKGITADKTEWEQAASRVAANLLPGMTFQHEVAEIRSSGPINRQCIELFRTATRGRKIEFARESADLSTSTAPLLDELVQVSADCPGATIHVTGHTDGTGDESANKALGKARADAVAAYMISRGIKSDRFVTAGAGSSQPLVNENTSQARQLNRRIEIELRFSQ